MNTGSTQEKAMHDYREALVLALRLKDIPGNRIGEIVAEVESHVADAGESPTDAFGAPKVYAKAVGGDRAGTPWWRIGLTVALPAAVAGWFGAQGVFGLLFGETHLGQSGWFWLALGLLIGVPTAATVRRSSSSVRDPRTGADMMPMPWWGYVVLGGVPVVIVLVTWAVIEFAS